MNLEIIVNKFKGKKDRELLHHILRDLHFVSEAQQLLLTNQNQQMATLAELQASVADLTAAVAAIPTVPVATGVAEADLDPIKASIDAATATVKTVNQPA